MIGFIPRERLAQSAYYSKYLPAGVAGHGGSDYRLLPQHRELNLAPSIRDDAVAYFAEHGIAWHQHANHALSEVAQRMWTGWMSGVSA